MTVRDFVEARIPALAWMPRYQQAWLRSDAIAGVTTASVIIPKAMAYATVAGLAVQVGAARAAFHQIVGSGASGMPEARTATGVPDRAV